MISMFGGIVKSGFLKPGTSLIIKKAPGLQHLENMEKTFLGLSAKKQLISNVLA